MQFKCIALSICLQKTIVVDLCFNVNHFVGINTQITKPIYIYHIFFFKDNFSKKKVQYKYIKKHLNYL